MTTSTLTVSLWAPEISSDGLTYDTPLGPVDLVAVARARCGHPVELTEAELTYLALDLGAIDTTDRRDPVQLDTRRLTAEALDLTTTALSARISYRLHRERTRTS